MFLDDPYFQDDNIQEEEVGRLDTQKKDMTSRNALGFERKFLNKNENKSQRVNSEALREVR